MNKRTVQALDALDDARAELRQHRRMIKYRIGAWISVVAAVVATTLLPTPASGAPLGALSGALFVYAFFGFVGSALWTVVGIAEAHSTAHRKHPARKVVLAERAYRDAINAENEIG